MATTQHKPSVTREYFSRVVFGVVLTIAFLFCITATSNNKDGKVDFGYGFGWFGWAVLIDVVELFELLGGK